MNKPECKCFDEDSKVPGDKLGTIMCEQAAATTAGMFVDMLGDYGICHKAGMYALVTTVCLMAHTMAEIVEGKNGARGDELFERSNTMAIVMLNELVANVHVRNGELSDKIRMLKAMEDKRAAGGVN